MITTGWTRILLALPAIAFIPVASAGVDEGFQVQIESHSLSSLDGALDWEAKDLAVGARSLGVANNQPLELQGSALRITVRRFELTWHIVEVPGRPPAWVYPQREPAESVSTLTEASFVYNSQNATAAAVLFVQRARLGSASGPIQVRGVAVDPALAGDRMYENHGARFNPEENGLWRVEGSYLAFAHGGLSGQANGTLAFYWSLGAVQVSSRQGLVELESRAWDDETVNAAGIVKARHVIWYRIEAADAEVGFSAAAPSASMNAVGFAKSATMKNLTSARLESYTHLSGSLPESSQQTGPSLWIKGPLDAIVKPLPADEGGTPAYGMSVSGHPTAYSIGGRQVVTLATAGLAAVPTLPLLAVAALYLKELVAYGAGRIGFGFYSKLKRDGLLESQTRDTLVRLIHESPGISYLELRAHLSTRDQSNRIGFGTLSHHLHQLESFGLIVSKRMGRFRRYFETGTGAQVRFVTAALFRQPILAGIARAIRDQPGISHSDLHRRVSALHGTSRPLLAYHVRKLASAGILDIRQTETGRSYHPTNRLHEALPLVGVDSWPEPVRASAPPAEPSAMV